MRFEPLFLISGPMAFTTSASLSSSADMMSCLWKRPSESVKRPPTIYQYGSGNTKRDRMVEFHLVRQADQFERSGPEFEATLPAGRASRRHHQSDSESSYTVGNRAEGARFAEILSDDTSAEGEHMDFAHSGRSRTENCGLGFRAFACPPVKTIRQALVVLSFFCCLWCCRKRLLWSSREDQEEIKFVERGSKPEIDGYFIKKNVANLCPASYQNGTIGSFFTSLKIFLTMPASNKRCFLNSDYVILPIIIKPLYWFSNSKTFL